MRKAGHKEGHPVNCPSCITSAHKLAWPGQSYIDVIAHPKHGPDIARKHELAVRRGLKSGALKF